MATQDPVIKEMLAEQAYGPLTSASFGDASKSARANETARQLGMDPDLVEAALPDMMNEARLKKRQDEARFNAAYSRIMSNHRLAAAAIDDDHLPTVAQRVDEHKNYVDFGKIGNPIYGTQAKAVAGLGVLAGRLLSGTAQLGQGVIGLGTAAAEMLPSGFLAATPLTMPLTALQGGRGLAAGKGLQQVSNATHYETSSRNFNDVASGVESLPGSLAALGVTVMTGSPAAGAGALGAITGGQSYLTGRDEGLTPTEALIYGAGDAAVETGTELLPEKYLGRALNMLPGGTSFVGDIAKGLGVEVAGEQIATALQGYNRWYWIDSRKGQTFQQFMGTLPDQERSTLVATLTGFGLTVGAGKIAQKVFQPRIDHQNALGVDGIMEASAQSQTRTANPSEFREALNQLVGDSEAANIYVPVEQVREALGETDVAADPFWSKYADQIKEAEALGGDVVIPLADAATELAGTPTWQAIREHVRTRPGGASISEAAAKRTPEELQGLAEQANTAITQSVRQGQIVKAREVVGNWSKQLGYEGERANVINRMLAHGLATRYAGEMSRAREAGMPIVPMEEFAQTWLPQATRMAQAEYDSGQSTAPTYGATNEQEAAQGQQAEPGPVPIGRGVFRGAELLANASGSVLGADEPIAGAPTELTVPGRGPVAVAPFRAAREAAASHMRNMGLRYLPARQYAKVDQARAERIAQAFEEMKHDPSDPTVAAAYDQMIRETLAQFQVIKETGLQIEFIDGEDPYLASPRLAILDAVENNHLWVFPTEGGFGQGEVTDSPMLRETDEFVDGRRLLVNDVFRIVHDYFGHIKDGHGFRAEGEENAWQSHAAMYSPLARRAMTTETRGQNSWLNFGPYAEFNRTASAVETKYAPQKVGLMPEWASEEGFLGGTMNEPQFGPWFEGSKVVDEAGKPLPMYHGTPHAFDQFESRAAVDDGIYFSSDFDYAEGYGKIKEELGHGIARTIRSFLSIKSPLVLNGENEQERKRYINRELSVSELRSQGYDGVLLKYADGEVEAMAFDPSQILQEGSNVPGIRAFHGTPFEFDTFAGGKAAWFAENESLAQLYSDPRRFRMGGEGRIIEAILDIRNPLDLDPALRRLPEHTVVPDGAAWAEQEFGFDLKAHGWERIGQDYAHAVFRSQAFADAAREAGYDALRVTEGGAPTWGMLKPGSISSAEGITLNQMVNIPGFSNIEPYLTSEERENLRAQSKEKILGIVKNLPDAEETAAVAVAGRAKKGWYASSAQAIVDVFGIADAPRFAALLAALSPQTSVEMNLYNALRVWTLWNNAGRPTDRKEIVQIMGEGVAGKKGSASVLGAWINNSVTALTAKDPGQIKLSGPKVDSFMQNLVGVVDEVTNDTWMANYADIQQEMFRRDHKGGKGPGYKAMNVLVRRAAEIATEKTGEDWTPSEIQEAVWSFARTLYLRRDAAGETRDMQTLLELGQVTHGDIAATPDFAVLFQDGFFRTILSEGGYDVTAIRRSGPAAQFDERGSVAQSEGTGFDEVAFRSFLNQAAVRLERVRQRRRGDAEANADQPELTFNQSVTPSEEVFYSAAQRVVSEAKQEKATAQQWKALLTPGKTPGIKTEEIEWTGIHDWLDMQQGPITKDALLQVLRDRGIQVEEVMLGGKADIEFSRSVEAEARERMERSTRTDMDLDDWMELVESERQDEIPDSATMFGNWSSDPSNPTYRELLITLPLGTGSNPERAPKTHWDTEGVVAHTRFMDKVDADGKRVMFVEEIQSDWHQKGRDQGYQAVGDISGKIAEAKQKRDDADKVVEEANKRNTELGREARKLLFPLAERAYKEQVEPAIAVLQEQGQAAVAKEEDDAKKLTITAEYLRRQQDVRDIFHRDTIGMLASPTEGNIIGWADMHNKLLKIRQIASIRGWEDEIPDKLLSVMDQFDASEIELKEATETLRLRNREFEMVRSGSGIPNAPFKSSWPALVMKRIIRYAAENGYDKVAWTTGKEQSQRYNLGEATGPIRIFASRGGEEHTVKVLDGAAQALVDNGMARFADEGKDYTLIMTNDQLKEAFGNDISQKLIEGSNKARAENTDSSFFALEGQDLEVGGEGMKAFYDRNLVNITNDIIKKYGAKVGQVDVATVANPRTDEKIDEWRITLADLEAEPRPDTDRIEQFRRMIVEHEKKVGRQNQHPGFEITDKMRDAALGGFPLFQAKRGNISIIPGQDGLMKSALIRAFESSNFSTAIHELGHFFLEDLRRRALSSGSTDQERADWEQFKNWSAELGQTVTDDGPIPVDAHEYFARGFERYHWEGQAPSLGMRHLFFRMREFMLELYRSATQFNSPITPEIRDVMGRMLASDEEVADQRRQLLMATGEVEKLMTTEERAAYQELGEEARQDARDKVFLGVLAGLKQEKTAQARARKREIREQVTADVSNEPVFQALKMLRVGMPNPDGSFTRVKLNRQQLVEAYGPDIEAQLPVRVMDNDSTLDVDNVAAITGYDSGDELVKALQTHETLQREMRQSGDRRSVQNRMIDDKVNDQYRDEVGDPMENLEEEAQAAVTNDRQADQLSMELRAIARKTGSKVTPWKLAKEWAEKRVRLLSSQEAVSGRAIQMYARNVSKAAAMAEEALAKGKHEEAFAAKQRQMLNMALLSEAKRAKDEVDTAHARLLKLASRPTIKSVEQDYLEQAHQLLEDVDLKTKSQAEVGRRMAFEDWYLDRVKEGIEPSVPSRYRTALGQTHWSRLNIEAFLELDRVVGQIVELGRLKKRLRDGQRQRDFDEGISDMVDQATTSMNARKASEMTDAERTFGGRIKSRLRGIDAAMIKMEQMVEWLDGPNEKNGPWRRMIFGVISDAQAREKDLTESYVRRLNDMIQAMPQAQARALDRKVDTPELIIRNSGHTHAGLPFQGTKDQILVMAMNWGNEGNRQRLLDGFGWQEHELLSVFDRLMTKEDWDFVQGVWDLVDELWPEIERLERAVNGVAPEKVQAVEVNTRHGQYRGGYFPVVYDPIQSTKVELDEASKLSPNGAWHQVTTRAGSSQSRVAQVKNRPVLLNMGVITRHIGEVIHDVTHRETVVQVRKILSDNRIRNVVSSRLGPEYYRTMGAWLENIATPNISNAKSDPAFTAVARHLNKGVSLVGLGFRFSTVLVQPIGLANSISEIGVRRVVEGLYMMMASPRTRYNEIVERSGEMRSRFNTMDASIEDMMGEAAKSKLRKIGPGIITKYAFHGILYMDMMVTTASWIGSYNKALAEGGSEEDAVVYADSVIRKTQGAGGQKDRSAIMSANQFQRSFYPFFSYLNALYNQQRDVMHRARRVEKASDLFDVARRGWWVMIVPTLVQALIFGNGPDGGDGDDPESWAAYLTKAVMLGNFAAIPGVGAIAAAIGSGYGYRSNAWQGIGEDLKKNWEDIDKLVTEDDAELKGSTIQKVLTTVGILTAKPLGQPAATARGAYDYATGETDPESAGDWYNLLTKGRIPDQPTAIQRLTTSDQEVTP